MLTDEQVENFMNTVTAIQTQYKVTTDSLALVQSKSHLVNYDCASINWIAIVIPLMYCMELMHLQNGEKKLKKKMKLKDEAEKLIPLLSERIIGQTGNIRAFDRDSTAVRVVEQSQNIKQGTFAAAGWADYRVHGPTLELQRHATQRVHA